MTSKKQLPLAHKPTMLGSLKYAIAKQIETTTPSLRVEMLENKQVVIDGSSGIIEYSDTTVRLNSKKHIIKISGTMLTLCAFTSTSVIVEGTITNVELM